MFICKGAGMGDLFQIKSLLSYILLYLMTGHLTLFLLCLYAKIIMLLQIQRSVTYLESQTDHRYMRLHKIFMVNFSECCIINFISVLDFNWDGYLHYCVMENSVPNQCFSCSVLRTIHGMWCTSKIHRCRCIL
jgi:hypothetical protein